MIIQLTLGKQSVIDDEDYSLVSGHSWHARKRRDGKGFYAVNASGIRMHRLLLGVWDSRIVDHRNGDGLNNRRFNIRVGTQSQNCVNRITTPGQFMRGVTFQKGLYRARIKVGGKMESLGYFQTEQEAHDAYCKRAAELHGDWRPLPLAPSVPR